MDMGAESKENEDAMDMVQHRTKMKSEDIDPGFKKQLGDVVTQYLAVKDALVSDDATKSRTAAKEMKVAIGKVNMKLLTDNDHHMSWMNAVIMMNEQIDLLRSESDIENQRTAFSKLSDDLTNIVQVLGVDLGGKALYLEFCPMASGNKGAYWLSKEKEIANPYFGDKMLRCGSVKEEL